MASVFNKGELEIQKQLGVQNTAKKIGKMISKTIIKGAIPFVERQSMAIASSIASDGNIWISLLVGNFGFTKVVHPGEIYFDRTQIQSTQNDIFYKNLEATTAIGTLFIELATRRRIRINGRASLEHNKIAISVDEAYPNCPKYIQQRKMNKPEPVDGSVSIKRTGTAFTEAQKKWIQNADTLFVGSASIDGKLDASHRGGPKGFVEITKENELKIPDYQGNNLYNTLGNFTENPKAALLFIDFETKTTLQLTGEVSMAFNQNTKEELQKSTHTGRFWYFKTTNWIETKNHHAIDWNFISYSPFNP